MKGEKISTERLRALPDLPGVYLMRDEQGTVLYIGKAKCLKARVRSYFSGGDERYSVQFLLERVCTIDTVVTEDERQAILLEADLIRKYKPRYNIRLKDDKAYLSVRIDMSQEWPRLELVRSERDDGAKYLGPFAFGYELRTLLEIVKRTVPLRTCSDHMLRNRVRPCIEYQIKRCSGPCCLEVDRAQYADWLQQAVQILQGKSEDVIESLQQEMLRASEDLRFEDAAIIRDRLGVLLKVKEDRSHVQFGDGSQDAFGLYREGARVELSILMVRRGRLFEAKSYGFADAPQSDEELLQTVLTQFYEGNVEVPEEILLPISLEDMEIRSTLLREKRGRKVELTIPKIGTKARLLSLACANAQENFSARFAGVDLADTIARALARELSLEEDPRVIECADISHFQGGSTVGSLVCFKDGKPDKSRYRHFIMTQEGKPDDFASMRELVMRHLSRGAEENTLADLLVIDGGPQQLLQAVRVRRELGLSRPELIGLAKKRTESLPYQAHHKSLEKARLRKPERIFVAESKEPIVLPPESETLHLLERIRNEAHRFAITFHRSRRAKKLFRSELAGIQGVGPKRRKELLKSFGSVKAIADSTPETLKERCGIPLELAERIIATLKKRRVLRE